jgi:hypothetical protein
MFRTYPPHWDSISHRPVLRNQQASFGRKFARASGWVLISEATEMTILLNSNPDFSKWRWGLSDVSGHLKDAYTLPPVIDKDDWFTDYVEHPYQGAFNYNALRSQGATIWQSALFTTLHSTLWEYVIEATEERPSIQDLITTPIGGSLLGELVHFVTMRMIKNGFTWYETIFVIVFDPTFILNNGFKFVTRPKPHIPRTRKCNLVPAGLD